MVPSHGGAGCFFSFCCIHGLKNCVSQVQARLYNFVESRNI